LSASQRQESVAIIAMAKIKSEENGISAFERKRLENIAANQAILKELSTTAKKIIPKALPKPATPRKRAIPVKKEPCRPTRTSSRLAGLEADSEVAKRKAEDNAELARDEAKAKRMRVAGDLNLSDIAVEGTKWNKSENFLTEIMRGAQPYERTFHEEDIRETTDESLKSLREKMSGLELYDTWEPNGKIYRLISKSCSEADSVHRHQNHPRTYLLPWLPSSTG
jgi:hypothetical protein